MIGEKLKLTSSGKEVAASSCLSTDLMMKPFLVRREGRADPIYIYTICLPFPSDAMFCRIWISSRPTFMKWSWWRVALVAMSRRQEMLRLLRFLRRSGFSGIGRTQPLRKEGLVNATTNDDPDYVFSRSNPTKDVRLEASVGSIGVCSF